METGDSVLLKFRQGGAMMAHMDPDDMSAEEFDARLKSGRQVTLDVRVKRVGTPYTVRLVQGESPAATGPRPTATPLVVSEKRALQNA